MAKLTWNANEKSDLARSLLECARKHKNETLEAYGHGFESAVSALEALNKARQELVEVKVAAILDGDREAYNEAELEKNRILTAKGVIVKRLARTEINLEK